MVESLCGKDEVVSMNHELLVHGRTVVGPGNDTQHRKIGCSQRAVEPTMKIQDPSLQPGNPARSIYWHRPEHLLSVIESESSIQYLEATVETHHFPFLHSCSFSTVHFQTGCIDVAVSI